MAISKGRVAIVTGAGSGIGRGIALALAQAGARVVVTDVNAAAGKAVSNEIAALGGEAICCTLDVRKADQCEAMVQTAVEHYGTVDILVNNAGLLRDALIHKMTEEQWDTVVDVILKGSFLCTQAVIRVMKEKKYGRIINISAVGQIGYRGQANYGAAKAGIIALTRTTAEEYTWCGVTANCIMPGPIKTPMTTAAMNGEWEKVVSSQMPVGRVGTPEDIAYMVKVLADDEASYINAQMIGVDGGFDLIKFKAAGRSEK